MTMTAVYIDIWQQCTLKGTGLKSLWVVDILGTGVPKCLPLVHYKIAHNSEHVPSPGSFSENLK